jgi:hypothetical protein
MEEQQRRKIGGAVPFSNFDASRGSSQKQRSLFTWGHQPMSKWLDAALEDHSLVPTLTIGRCKLVLISVLSGNRLGPGFGCRFGSLRSAAESDESFDPYYRPSQLEVPVPLITESVPPMPERRCSESMSNDCQ